MSDVCVGRIRIGSCRRYSGSNAMTAAPEG